MDKTELDKINGLTILFDKGLFKCIREVSPKYADIKKRNDQASKASLKEWLFLSSFLLKLEISTDRQVSYCAKLITKLLQNNNVNSLPLMNNHGKTFDEWLYENQLRYKVRNDPHFNSLYI